MSDTKRQSGYYWVKRKENAYGSGEWEVLSWKDNIPLFKDLRGAWIAEGMPKLTDCHMIEINETRILNPDENLYSHKRVMQPTSDVYVNRTE